MSPLEANCPEFRSPVRMVPAGTDEACCGAVIRRPLGLWKTLPAQYQNGLAREEGTDVEPLVIHPHGWRANRIGSEIQVPGNSVGGPVPTLREGAVSR